MAVPNITPTDVKEIISSTMPETSMQAFIDAAKFAMNALIGEDTTLTTNQKFEITRWYCAHLIACTKERQVMKENLGQGEATYSGTTGTGFSATLYGQQCLMFDTTGTLSRHEINLSKRLASIYAVPEFEE